MRRAFLFSFLGIAVAWGVACANGQVLVDEDAGTDDGGGGADQQGMCPQYDLQTDSKHCGTCTHSCNVDQVCAAGMCKGQCDPPTTKCAGDAGGCFDLTSDTKHCGACGTSCTVSDGGGMDPGTGNPDGGMGMGWTVGMPACTNGACSITCPMGFTACGDGVCYDLKNHHENCGMCGTACQSTEWCTQGNCCAANQQVCNNMCADVLSDDNNCGQCGKVCGNGLHCSNGVCQTCGGYASLNSCWYVSALGASCNTTCQNHGGLDSVNGKHTGNPICTHFYPQKANGGTWVTVECCSTDNNTNWGANNTAPDGTFTFAACYLACPCKT